jgi:anaerobic magnesium-protoporphyrin IX monomethyl ester cyclase
MTRRSVLLINPRMCRPKSVRLPLSVLALGAALEGRYDYEIIDGNLDSNAMNRAVTAAQREDCALVGVTVMPGPQVAPAIEISAAIRAARPSVPIAWGGYFPTLYPDSAINAPYVDYVVRGEGERTIIQLLERLSDAGSPHPASNSSSHHSDALRDIPGVSWKQDGQVVHNPNRGFVPPDEHTPLPYERVGDVGRYLRPSFMGSRTAVHQAALGCRYHCTFCGVVSMFDGYTRMGSSARLELALTTLSRTYGANAMQFYDHNFFDNEESSQSPLEVLSRFNLPWWCYARADTLAKFSRRTWDRLRASHLRMAYIGAEAGSDAVLRRMKKGSRAEHTIEVARLCREYGVIPEFSFVLGGPEDPEGEIENTLQFIKKLKGINPECEVILYFYSPTPQRATGSRKDARPLLASYGPSGPELPATPEEWTQPQWLNYVCHQDAPWLSPKMRRRVRDFARVLACRFPTVQDYATPAWGKALLKTLANWRYESGRYANAWELELARRFIPLRQPQRDSL